MRIEISGNVKNAELEARVMRVLGIAVGVLGLPELDNAFVEIDLLGSDVMDKNVMSYPAPEKFPLPEAEERFLGEIHLNPVYIEKHGEDFDLMLVHGFLHLLGYDHKDDRDAQKMEAKEEELLKVIKQ